MFKKKGFTLVELIVVIVIIGVIAAVVIPMFIGATTGRGSSGSSFGVNGYVETRCMDGLKFVVGRDGSVRQVMDQFGKGVPCP